MENNAPYKTNISTNAKPRLNIWIIVFLLLVIINLIISVRKFITTANILLSGASSPVYLQSIALNTVLIVLAAALLWLLFKRKRAAIKVAIVYLFIQLIMSLLTVFNPYFIMFLVSSSSYISAVAQYSLSFEALFGFIAVAMSAINLIVSAVFLWYFSKSRYVAAIFIR